MTRTARTRTALMALIAFVVMVIPDLDGRPASRLRRDRAAKDGKTASWLSRSLGRGR